jgi:sarcosine oxidase subunit beta
MHGPAAGVVIAEDIVDGRAHTINIDPLRWRQFAHNGKVQEYAVI